MKDDRSFDELRYAIITSVVRDGPDVVLTFRNARHPRRILKHCRFIATLRLVDAPRINSWAPNAPDSEFRLEPGWMVWRADFDGLSAGLVVQYEYMHDSYEVCHRIWCDEARLKMSFDPHGTFMAYYFPGKYTSVEGEPRPSPAIEGQEGRVGT